MVFLGIWSSGAYFPGLAWAQSCFVDEMFALDRREKKNNYYSVYKEGVATMIGVSYLTHWPWGQQQVNAERKKRKRKDALNRSGVVTFVTWDFQCGRGRSCDVGFNPFLIGRGGIGSVDRVPTASGK